MFLNPILHSVNPVHSGKPDIPVNPVNPKIPILISAILISFVGSLPLGTVNVVTVQLAITDGYSTALWFAAGCLIAEMLYVGISLTMMDRIMKIGILLKLLQWVSLINTDCASHLFFCGGSPERTCQERISIAYPSLVFLRVFTDGC